MNVLIMLVEQPRKERKDQISQKYSMYEIFIFICLYTKPVIQNEQTSPELLL